MDLTNNLRQFLTIKQLLERHQAIPEGGIRHLIFTNKDFCRLAVKKVGRKILIDEQAFLAFINDSRKED